MSDAVRAAVARFFNVPETAVTDDFVLPPERLQGSIARRILHAAIKRLADADLPGVWTARTYSELFHTPLNAAPAVATSPLPVPGSAAPGEAGAVGIDIEQVSALPWSGDPWTDSFYVENFTEAEKAYAMRQTDPRQSLAGMWCAKEATLKCGADFAAVSPARIEIAHDEHGRPRLVVDGRSVGCEISIAHSGGTAVAVCVRPGRPAPAPVLPPPPAPAPVAAPSGSNWLPVILSLLALVVAAVALLRG